MIALQSLPHGGNGHEMGRQLLQRMYLRHVGEAPPPIVIAPGGKPGFATGGVHFSISHTKKRVFCALSHRPIGIDAEEADRPIDLRLAQKILSPAEKLRYAAAPDPRAALLRLWVLKEAAAKRTGLGLRGYPDHTDFSPDDHRVQYLDGCYVAVLEEEEDAV